MAAACADAIRLRAWEDRTRLARQEVPLAMASIHSEGMPFRSAEAWPVADARLRALREDQPDDPEAKLPYAAHLHAKYVVGGPILFEAGRATCAADEAKIELLVLDALDVAQSRPDDAILAGKLRDGVSRSCRHLAVDLIETAHATNAAPVLSPATVGQSRALRGRLDDGIDLLDQAVALGPAGTERRVYTLVLLAQTLIAARAHDRLAEARADLVACLLEPGFIALSPLLDTPDRPSEASMAAARMMTPARTAATLAYLDDICARLYQDPAHGAEILRGPSTLFRRRFGADFGSEEGT